MKKYAAFSFLTALLVACGGGEEETETIEGHLISGTVTGGDGEAVILTLFENGEEKLVDSTRVVDGKFELTTATKDLRQYVLQVGADQMPLVLFLDRFSKDIQIKGSIPGFGENYSVSGSKPSEELVKYLAYLGEYRPKETELMQGLRMCAVDDTLASNFFRYGLDSISAMKRDHTIELILADSTCPSRWVLLRDLFPYSGVAGFDSTDLKYFQMVANGMRSRYPESDYPDLIDADIVSLQNQIVALHNPSAVNASADIAPEIELSNTSGKTLALSSLRGKVVLLDFWASWCKPCRMENPNVVAAYEKWKNKGFTVYSVSLDDDRNDWMQAIKDDNLSWPNHVSDLKGWDSPVVPLYGIQGIPATYLLDKEGKIIGRDLRGSDLEQKLQEILG